MKTLLSHLKNEKGQGMVEYAVILVLIVAVVVLLMSPGGALNDAFQTASDNVTAAIPSGTGS